MSEKWNIWICEIYSPARAHALKGYAIQTHTQFQWQSQSQNCIHKKAFSISLSLSSYPQFFKWMQSSAATALNQMIAKNTQTQYILRNKHTHVCSTELCDCIFALNIHVTDSNEHWNCNELCVQFSFTLFFEIVVVGFPCSLYMNTQQRWVFFVSPLCYYVFSWWILK